MTLDEIMAGLKAGRVLVVDRKDFPHLPTLLKMSDEGTIQYEFVEYDEQSAAYKFRMAEETP